MSISDLEDLLARNIAQMREEEERSWEDRLAEARQEWEHSQISLQKEGAVYANNPYLQNVNEDPQLSGVVKHCLAEGTLPL